MTFIDEGNALTLDEVLKIGLKHSRDRPSTANAYITVRAADTVCNRACPLGCTRGSSPHPASRNSSIASSSQGRNIGVGGAEGIGILACPALITDCIAGKGRVFPAVAAGAGCRGVSSQRDRVLTL
jgi:hypothetical protein